MKGQPAYLTDEERRERKDARHHAGPRAPHGAIRIRGEAMTTAALFRILDTRRRIEAIQQARRNIVIRRQLAAMRASA